MKDDYKCILCIRVYQDYGIMVMCHPGSFVESFPLLIEKWNHLGRNFIWRLGMITASDIEA